MPISIYSIKGQHFLLLQEPSKVVKRSNSQLRHKTESKPVVLRNGEYFEQIDSGWTSRDSSSMDRSVILDKDLGILSWGRQNERNSRYVGLAHTSIFGLCFMSVCLMKSNCYSLLYSSLAFCQAWMPFIWQIWLSNQ